MISLDRISDLDSLMQWRIEVIEHVFGHTPDADLIDANRKYYMLHISDGSHEAFVAKECGQEVGCGSVCLTDELPSPDNPSGRCAYLMNIYVRSPFRRHGIGHAIVSRLVDEAREKGCGKIYLETTAQGRSVYESLGFRDMDGMMKLYSENYD